MGQISGNEMMASRFHTPKENVRNVEGVRLGRQPFNRDSISLAFGPDAKHAEPLPKDGQSLAGTGALVFEGEVLELPSWH